MANNTDIISQKQDAFYKALVQATNESVKVATNKMNEFFEHTFPKINSTFMAYEKHLDTTLTQIKDSKILEATENNGKISAQKQLNEGLQYNQLVSNQNQAFSNINIALQQIINIMKKPTMKENLQTMGNISNANNIPVADLYANRQLMGKSGVGVEKADEIAKKTNELFSHKDNLMQSDWIKSVVEARSKENPELLKQLQQARTQTDFSNLLRQNIEAINNKKDKTTLDKSALNETKKYSGYDDDVYTSYISSGAEFVSYEDQDRFKSGNMNYAKQRKEVMRNNPGYAAQEQGWMVQQDYEDSIKKNIQTHQQAEGMKQTKDIHSEAVVGGTIAKGDQKTIDDFYDHSWKTFFDNGISYFKKEYKDYYTPDSLKEVEGALVSLAKLGNFSGKDFGSVVQSGTELGNSLVTNVGAAVAADQGLYMSAPLPSKEDVETYEAAQQQADKYKKQIQFLQDNLGVSVDIDQNQYPQLSRDPLNNNINAAYNFFASPYGGGHIFPDTDDPNSISYKYKRKFAVKTPSGTNQVQDLSEIAANVEVFMTETARKNIAALKQKGLNVNLDQKTQQIGILQDNGKMLLPLKDLINLPLKQLERRLSDNPDILKILQQQTINNNASALKKKNSQSSFPSNKPDNIDQNKRGLLSPVLMPKKTSSLPTEEIIRNSINKPSLPYASSYNTNTNSKLINQILNMPRSISQKLDLSFTFNPTQGGTIKHSIENNIPVSSKNSGAASVVHKDYSQMVVAKH